MVFAQITRDTMQITLYEKHVQRSAKKMIRGCEKFVLALAHLFCPALPGSCLARFAYFFADLCTRNRNLSVA